MKVDCLTTDLFSLKHLAECVKVQQIEEEFKCKYLTGIYRSLFISFIF